ncbi:MAG: helix-turn-helix domain-containing protein [Bacteroides sp.]|nr:helix-turn-helix domain-containing protein [Prevotella sp.]MCM1407826.1 helix-turn-helix domain-containing protein [Treponema brennaborense]MCM1470879.1 helix-turn-helix domain-containing protein [Bacteroides sp.]
MDGIREIFINNLKFYRKAKKMTQLELSVELEKSANYIAAIENSASFPPPETIDRIAEILGINSAQLFDAGGSPENVLSNNRRQFSEEVAEELERRISRTIRKEIREVMGNL